TKPSSSQSLTASKARRVRTGCFTCRDRHLKCDETTPRCIKCIKGDRECKYGVRLSWMDSNATVKNPPKLVSPAADWSVKFQDESREIASEYRGGLALYPKRRNLAGGSVSPVERYPNTDHAPQNVTPAGMGLHASSMVPTPDIFSSDHSAAGQRNPIKYLPDPRITGYHNSVGHPQPPSQAGGQGQINYDVQSSQNSFTLAALQHYHATKEDTGYQMRSRRDSDVSSVTSSLIPEGGPASDGGKRSPRHGSPDGLMTPLSDKTSSDREYLSTEDEIRFMQVFINDVAIWMDTLDKDKHFANMTPYLSLKSPMLLNAFLACGAKHISLKNPTQGESYYAEKARCYYDTSSSLLLRSLQNPDRDTDESAVCAVVLNVYEIMNEKPEQRMGHIAGARALIRERQWNAASTGLAAACFWLNVGMEVLSCLSFNWKTAWDPDEWGMDLEFTTWIVGSNGGSVVGSEDTGTSVGSGGGGAGLFEGTAGDEELWTQRMFFIVAKVVNFRASIPRFQEASPHDEQVRLQSRYAEWNRLKALLDAWNQKCPRSMRPYGYSHEPSTKSYFPNVWLISRPAVIGRLFYHTCMCLLYQMNPMNPHDTDENRVLQKHHGRQVCGIVAHTHDRGVASVAVRGLAVGGAVLDDRREQDEVMAIIDRIGRDSGWRLQKDVEKMKKAWGWEGSSAPTPLSTTLTSLPGMGSLTNGGGNIFGNGNNNSGNNSNSNSRTTSISVHGNSMTQFQPQTQAQPQQQEQQPSTPAPVLAAPIPTRPIVNPILVNAEFGLQGAPYQSWYMPPNNKPAAAPADGSGGVANQANNGHDTLGGLLRGGSWPN
ncbi:adhesion and hyphal regulator 1, partial [Podospora australis]